MDADGTHPIQEKNNTGEDRDKRTNDSVAKSQKKKKPWKIRSSVSKNHQSNQAESGWCKHQKKKQVDDTLLFLSSF